MKKEHALSNQIRLWAGSNDVLCFHINVGKFLLPNGFMFDTGAPKGWPDLIFLTKQGKVFFVETKVGNNTLNDDQARLILELRQRKFEVFVIYHYQQFLNAVEELKKKAYF